MKKYFSFAVLSLSCLLIQAQDVTWANDIAPILYQKCTSCHHPGGAGHGSLITYAEALSASIAIQYQTGTQQMPPWLPDRSYKHFTNERYLTEGQISLIDQWVNAGAPEGNPEEAPLPPVYDNEEEITSPDFSARIPTYTLSDNNDVYRCFVIPTNFPQDEYITGIEIIPGNGSIVHHILVFEDTTGTAQDQDSAGAGIGYTSIVGVQSDAAKLIGGWEPGQKASFFPSGMGVKLWKGADLVIQIHYPKNNMGQIDSTKINLKLSTDPGIRNIYVNSILHHTNGENGGLIDGPLYIPANEIKTFHARFTNDIAQASILSVAPHMHYIGKSITAFAVSPSNDTLPLIKINNWDFNRQEQYTFQRLQIIPMGYKMYAEATYDNTTDNPNNPNKQNPIDVVLGEGQEGEMMLVYFWYMLYEEGDEDIVIDSTDYTNETSGVTYGDLISTIQFYEPFPNPANDFVHLRFYLPNSEKIEFKVYDQTGKIVYTEQGKNFQNGLNEVQIPLSNLASGIYQITLQSMHTKRSKPLVIRK